MVSRRIALAALTGAPLFGMAARAAASATAPQAAVATGFPARFKVTGTYLNAAYTHPLSLESAAAAQAFLAGRVDPAGGARAVRNGKALFARLINAAPEEIAFLPSTSYGESFVVGALGLRTDPKAKVVTDILHFDGSLYTYQQIQKQGGAKVVILPMTAEGRIDMNRLEDAVDDRTRLVAISLVSMVNGFEHDLKTVCDIAHRKGAYVYADIIQGAGAVPIDVKASGVDFAACSSFKWLQGEFGVGFLYVRADLLPRLARSEFGYRQAKAMDYHVLPGDPPGQTLFESAADDATAMGRFEVGSIHGGAEAAVTASLTSLLSYGVARVQADRQPVIERLRQGLGRRYQPLTPPDSTSGIIAFSAPDAPSLKPRLNAAGITIQVYDHRFRVSPSVYNTVADADRLVEVLAG